MAWLALIEIGLEDRPEVWVEEVVILRKVLLDVWPRGIGRRRQHFRQSDSGFPQQEVQLSGFLGPE
jgi:hypothetical protein